MKRKLFVSGIIVFVLVCILLLPISNINFDEKHEKQITQDSRTERQEETLYEKIMSQFVIDDERYSNNFAGIYKNQEDELIVGVLELGDYNTFGGEVLYVEQEFSYNYLLSLKKRIVNIMKDFPNFVGVGIKDDYNRLDVFVERSQQTEEIERLLKKEDLLDNKAINYIVKEGIRTTSNSTAYGGDRINTQTLGIEGRFGTICANAYDNSTGKYGVLTNYHVAKSDEMFLGGSFGAKIGTATKVHLGGTLDAAFIPFENQNNWEITKNAISGTSIYSNIYLGKKEDIIVNAPIIKFGQTTGITDGVITHTNYSAVVNYGTTEESNFVTIEKAFRCSAKSEPGDSGGPIYYNDKGKLWLIGMDFAGPTDYINEKYAIGCSIFDVMDTFDVTPITNGTMYSTTKISDTESRLDSVNVFSNDSTVSIPYMINGEIITEIGENVFADQTSITQIILPSTVTKINSGAFKNCLNLTSISGTGNVQYLGSNAFEGCVNLVAVDSMKKLTTIECFAFKNCTSLTSVSGLSNVYQIKENAFEGCSSLVSVEGLDNLYQLKNFAFKGCSSLTSIYLPTSLHYIGDGVFSGCNNLDITVSPENTAITAQDNIVYDIGMTKISTSGAVPSTVTLPSTVTYIRPYAFGNNTNITKLNINQRVTIDNYAFSGCTNLTSVYFYTYDTPIVGNCIFDGVTLNIYVPHSKQGTYAAIFSEVTTTISFIPITIIYNSDGVVVGQDGYYYGAVMNEPMNVGKTGYSFVGWYDNEEYYGEPYVAGIILDSTVNIVLYAKWEANEYTISFICDGVESIADKTVTYNSPIGELPQPDREGYIFNGWKDELGNTYTAETVWQEPNNKVLIAQWDEEIIVPIEYAVTLDKQNGSGGSDLVRVCLNDEMPEATAPSREGYNFEGYYTQEDGYGTKYYDSEMNGVIAWNITGNATLYAYWVAETYNITLEFNAEAGAGGTTRVTAIYNEDLPSITIPTRYGYIFQGYYLIIDYEKVYYYDKNGIGEVWNIPRDSTLQASWEKEEFNVILDYKDGTTENIRVLYNEGIDFEVNYGAQYVANHVGHDFKGFYTEPDGQGTLVFDWTVEQVMGDYLYKLIDIGWKVGGTDQTLHAYWTPITYSYAYEIRNFNDGSRITTRTVSMTHGNDVMVTAPTVDGYTYKRMWINSAYSTATSNKITAVQLMRDLSTGLNGKAIMVYKSGGSWLEMLLFMEYAKNECVAEGTMITLADGTQKAVEELTGNELLLVWNLQTGSFDTAPVLFVDSDPTATYKVINLTFSDGTTVKVIGEHGFWDITLNKYVYLRCDAEQYVGHYFRKTNGSVQLTSVEVRDEVTSAWSPVTAGHLCYYVNGMLSMPGGIEGLFNIFEVDAETMAYDSELMASDIAQYGLYTYEEFYETFPISEEAFEAFNGRYLKVAIGKGLLTEEDIARLIQTYSEFLG